MPLPSPDLLMESLPPSKSLPAQSYGKPNSSPHSKSAPLGMHGAYKSQSNTFGLFHIFDALPRHDPDDLSDEDPIAQGTWPHCDEVEKENLFHSYPNESSLRLGNWYWNQELQKSRSTFRKLLDIVGSVDFQPDNIRATKWTAIDHALGILDPSDDFPHCKASGEWLNVNAGWMHSLAIISVLFSQRSLHPGPRDYTVEDFYHHSLISIIREMVLDISHHKSFHFEPYKLCWHPPHKACDVGVHRSCLPPRHFLKPTESCRNLLPSRVVSYRIGWSH
jgi:hypothetical protein